MRSMKKKKIAGETDVGIYRHFYPIVPAFPRGISQKKYSRTFTSKMASKANATEVGEHQLYFAYKKIQEQLVYELFFVHANEVGSVHGDQQKLIADLRALLSAPLFAENELIGPGQQATNIQKQLGSFLASPESQDWVARFLAFPIERENSNKVTTVRQEIMLNSLNPGTYTSELFSNGVKVKQLVDMTALAEEAKRHLKLHKDNFSLARRDDTALLAGILINFSARFLLLQSHNIVARGTKEIEVSETQKKETVKLPGVPDVYALNPFALSVVLQLVKRVKAGSKLTSTLATKPTDAVAFGSLPPNSNNKDYLWSALPWRTAVAVAQVVALIALNSEEELAANLDVFKLQKQMAGLIKKQRSELANSAYANDRIYDYQLATVFSKTQIEALKAKLSFK